MNRYLLPLLAVLYSSVCAAQTIPVIGQTGVSADGAPVASLADVAAAIATKQDQTLPNGSPVTSVSDVAAAIAAAIAGKQDTVTAMQLVPSANNVNAPQGMASATGLPVIVGAAGNDPSITLTLAGKGPAASVRLDPNGGAAVRVANPAAGDTGLLIQPGIGTVFFNTETTNPNASIELSAQGTGQVIISGALVATSGVCLISTCAVTVGATGDGSKIVFKVGGANVASIDGSGNLRLLGSVMAGTAP